MEINETLDGITPERVTAVLADRLPDIRVKGFLTAFFTGMSPRFGAEVHSHHDPATTAAVTEAQQMMADGALAPEHGRDHERELLERCLGRLAERGVTAPAWEPV